MIDNSKLVCPKCRKTNWFAIDNAPQYSDFCRNCYYKISYWKQDFLTQFHCEKCNNNNGTLNDKDNYITITCSDCGHENYILKKNNDTLDNRNLVSPVNNKKPVKKFVPKCPMCQSPNIRKLTAAKRITHGLAFGLFSKTARSQWVCNSCGNKW